MSSRSTPAPGLSTELRSSDLSISISLPVFLTAVKDLETEGIFFCWNLTIRRYLSGIRKYTMSTMKVKLRTSALCAKKNPAPLLLIGMTVNWF